MPVRHEKPVVSSRYVAAVAAIIIVGIFAGCMSLNIGRTSNHVTSESVGEDGIFLQQGIARIKGGGDADVHYAVPFQRPPNLELGDDSDHCEIVEQHEDHFRIHNSSPFKVEAHWKARGVKTPSGPLPAGTAATAIQPLADPPPPDPPPTKAADPGAAR